jgi:hypothetical protein
VVLPSLKLVVTVVQDMLAERHYMQRGSGSNVVLGEADGLHDAAAACLAVGLLASLKELESRAS